MTKMSRDLHLAYQQIKYQNKIFWRTPVAAFFTIAFPLMFLVLFTAIFGNDEIEELGVTTAQFYAPGLAVFAVASATYTNLAVTTAIARDDGILKKVRGTPLPAWVYIAGRVGSAVWIALIAALVMMTVGVVVYDVELVGSTLAAAALSFVVGASAFAALGLMVAALVPNGDSAPAVANATLLPLAFVSNVFLVVDDAPPWMARIGDVFPLKHFVASFGDAFNPTLNGTGFAWSGSDTEYGIGLHLLVMAAWGLGAVFIAVR
ncbi:MAG: ABC transporter permease, partial [Acidimicrobiia bacterium]|nr:ABC transporter permease [Acidimicrobiia bacterium]